MTPERLEIVRRDMAIIDGLPKAVRELVHEYGAKKVLQLHARGLSPDEIKQHFRDEAVFSDLF